MGKIILTSDGIDSEEIYNEYIKCVNKESKIAIVPTAKDEKEKAKGPQKALRQFVAMGVKTVDFVDLEFDDPRTLLDYDLIHLEGGSPFRLMHYIRESNSAPIFKKIVKSNRVLAGRSAGSMVLGKNFSICNYLTPHMNTMNMVDFSGLGLVDFNICPHYNAFPSMYENCEQKLKQCEKDNQIKITKLYDGNAIVIDNEKKTITNIVGQVQNI